MGLEGNGGKERTLRSHYGSSGFDEGKEWRNGSI